MRKGTGAAWAAGAFVVCALLAAPAAAQEGCDDLKTCLHPLAKKVARVLTLEAKAQGKRLEVSFRPAWTEPSGVLIYCHALSRGLRSVLHEGVQEERDHYVLNFDLRTPDLMQVNPPEVGMAWTPDRTGGGDEILDVEVIVTLKEGRVERRSDEVPASALSRRERACLFSFERRREGGKAKVEEGGRLFSEPSIHGDAWVANYEKGDDRLRVLGCATAVDGGGDVWPVVAWTDEKTRKPVNLFATGLAGECAADGDAPVVDGGGDGVKDPPPEIEVGAFFRDCEHCPEMVVVPAGRFEMGSPPSEEGRDDDEGPQHEVTIGSPFAVGVHEVTFDEWDACVSGGGCGGYSPDDMDWGRRGRPVVNVSWRDARAYASWLSRETGEEYRLLSEAEWEYVARAGTVTRYWWGDDIGRNRANCVGCGSRWDGERTAPVGNFRANAFGLHDVHGNVFEWVEDCWHASYARAPRDGSAWLGGQSGDCSQRVLRGGSWFFPRDLRAAGRGRKDSVYRNYGIGFRVSRTLAR